MSAGEQLIRLPIALLNTSQHYAESSAAVPTLFYSIIMDILVQKPVFRHSSTEYYESPPSGYYTPYNTPPYSQALPVAPHPGWHLGEQMPSAFQLTRFPTPPITPDQHPPHSPRTQSVIMKCSRSSSGSGSGSPTESYSDHCSSSSSSSSGGDCDFLCNWHDCGR